MSGWASVQAGAWLAIVLVGLAAAQDTACGPGERVVVDDAGVGSCTACGNAYFPDNAAGDDPAGGETVCDPPPDFRLSFDAIAVSCREEMKSCWAVEGCIDATTQILGTWGIEFPDGHTSVLSAEFVDLITCAAQLGPAPPPPPPARDATDTGGLNEGTIFLDLGGLYPLTGDGCGIGWQAYFATQLAVDMLNCENGKGVLNSMLREPFMVGVSVGGAGCESLFDIALHVGNTDARVAKALFEADQLLHTGMDAIIGPLNNEVAMHVALLAEHEHVPVISYGAAMPKLSGLTSTDDSHFARTFPSDKIVLKALVDFVEHKKWKGVTFVTTANEFGYDGAREWQSSLAELQTRVDNAGEPWLHSQIVLVDPNNPEDIRNQLQLVKDGDWRIVVCHAVENDATRIMHEAAYLRMTKLSWVWLGTEWLTESFFLHEITPHDGEVDCTQECTSEMDENGEETEICETVCPMMTGEYLREELTGLVAVQVADIYTDLGKALSDEYVASKTAFENATMCPEVVKMDVLHKAAVFAFDAVLASVSGARVLADQRSGFPERLGHWWRKANAGVRTKGLLMEEILKREMRGVASGDISFSANGDSDMVRFALINLKPSVSDDGSESLTEFVKVGSWFQTHEQYEHCVDTELCGILNVEDSAIVWMGNTASPPTDREVHVNHIHAKYMTLVVVFLIVSIIGGNAMELIHFHYMPEAGLTMIIGFGTGILVLLYGQFSYSHHMEELARFDAATFNLVLLPIIIFDAGFGAKKAMFFGNIGPIMLCALIGTSISAILVGVSMYNLSDLTDVKMGFSESMTYGALVSAVDPVATLAVFGVLKVEPNLNYRVFGESIINDAVSIVLFRVFGTYIVAKYEGWKSVRAALWMFGSISFGSFFMGILVALAMSLIMKVAHIHDPLLAAGTFIIGSYIAFEVTEAIHWSGIIASLFCGFAMRHYAIKNIAEKYRDMVIDMVHMLALMADLCIFFSVGINIVLQAPYEKATFIMVTTGLCLVGRMCNIFPLCGLYNLVPGRKEADRIPFADQIVMVHSGGLRGAIAYSLAIGFPSQNQPYVIDATIWIILITVFICGGSTVPMLKALGIQTGIEDNDEDEMKVFDGKALRDRYRDGWSTDFDWKFRLVVMEFKLQRFIVREPEQSLGVFAGTWWDLTDEQREAAETLGYSGNEDDGPTWPEANRKWEMWELEHDYIQVAARKLGLGPDNWPPPDFSRMYDADSTVKQHASGHDVGYDGDNQSVDYAQKIEAIDGQQTDSPSNRQKTSNPMLDESDSDGASANRD